MDPPPPPLTPTYTLPLPTGKVGVEGGVGAAGMAGTTRACKTGSVRVPGLLMQADKVQELLEGDVMGCRAHWQVWHRGLHVTRGLKL